MLQRLFVFFLLLTIVFGGSYIFYGGASQCRYPIAYRIGDFDDRFSITRAEARNAIHDAETLWEQALNKHLFTYDEDASFTINFVFDDRQSMTDEQRTAREALEEMERNNVRVTNQYNELLAELQAFREQYEIDGQAYDARLAQYNTDVERYNQTGGAPPEEFERLQAEQVALREIARELNQRTESINRMAEEINALGAEGNRLVDAYNEKVAHYNNRFGQSREFTQGDFRGNLINIYTFSSPLELRQVLAHELGHALGLGHVDDSQSIMYYLMGTQPDELVLTEADLAEFERVCGDGPGLRAILQNFLYRYF